MKPELGFAVSALHVGKDFLDEAMTCVVGDCPLNETMEKLMEAKIMIRGALAYLIYLEKQAPSPSGSGRDSETGPGYSFEGPEELDPVPF